MEGLNIISTSSKVGHPVPPAKRRITKKKRMHRREREREKRNRINERKKREEAN